jgi:hypothetical protein
MAPKHAIHAISWLRCRHLWRGNGIEIEDADYLDGPTAISAAPWHPIFELKSAPVTAKSAVCVS